MFGYIYQPDPRDKYYSMPRVLGAVPYITEPLPNKRLYATGPILHQGATRMCVGYTFAQWLVSEPIITTTGPSAEIIYHEAHLRDEIAYMHDGTTLRAALKYLQEKGHIASYVWAFDVPTIVTWILCGQGTVVMGTPWYKGMNTLNAQGIVSVTGPVLEGHAYLLSGYDQERHLFRIVNSWGVEWGDYGEAWIRGDDLALLLAAGEACCGIEQKLENPCQTSNTLISSEM